MLETTSIQAESSAAVSEAVWGGNLRLRRILCPVDMSEISERALHYAARIASHYDARLLVQHTVAASPDIAPAKPGTSLQIDGLPAEIQSRELDVRQMMERTGADRCHVSLILNDGDPEERILETIQSAGIDLMVIGTHGRRGLHRLVQGSLTERIVHRARCPSLVLSRRSPHTARHSKFDPLKLRTILVPVDFSTNSMRLVLYALQWAWDESTRVVLLHSVETAPAVLGKLSDLLPEYGADIEVRLRQAFTKMRELVSFPERLPCRVEFEVRDGDPTDQILRVAKEKKASLIVMGARVLSNPAAMWGSTITGVLRNGRYPVLAIRHLGE
jgi:nucleotide-binding universal stress UspA family protein